MVKYNKIDTIQFTSYSVHKYNLKTPIIIVAGIALKCQVDLIFIMVPLEVAAKNNTQ